METELGISTLDGHERQPDPALRPGREDGAFRKPPDVDALSLQKAKDLFQTAIHAPLPIPWQLGHRELSGDLEAHHAPGL